MTPADRRPLIFSTHPVHPAAAALMETAGTFVVASAPTADAFLAEGLDADILIVRAPIPPEFFARAPRLRAAIRHGAGLDMIPVEAATASGVLVANVPAVNAQTVAEYAIFAALALLRRFRRVDRDLRGTGWAAGRAHADEARELSGLRMSIVGMGNVGRAIHRIAHFGFSMPVSATTRSPSSLPEGVTALDLDTLMAESDVVVLCCPLTPETTGLINRERIGLMKRDALLINVSRGPVVDQQALVAALRERRIGGAALDVFESQPLDPADPLFGLDNVLLTPHLAGITQESMRRMGEGAARETQRVLAGDVPLNFRNPDVLEAYRRRFPKP